LTATAFSKSPGEIIEGDAEWTLPLDGDGGHTIRFNDGEVLQLARAGLVLAQGIELSWNDILNTLVPISLPMADALAKLCAEYSPDRLDEAIEAEIAKLDAIIGPALGLSPTDVAEIRRDMIEDPFLARVRPGIRFSGRANTGGGSTWSDAIDMGEIYVAHRPAAK
jgi:hypothetical protein